MDPDREEIYKIIVVDDETEIAKIIARSAKRIGYETTTYSDPNEALKKLKEESFDVLVTDLRMPEIEGLDLIRHIADIKHAQKMKIIIITGDGGKEDAIEAIRLKVHDFLEKPLVMPRLETILKNTLDLKKTERQRDHLLKKILTITK